MPKPALVYYNPCSMADMQTLKGESSIFIGRYFYQKQLTSEKIQLQYTWDGLFRY